MVIVLSCCGWLLRHWWCRWVGDAGGLGEGRGVGGAAGAVPDEREAHVGARGHHGCVAPEPGRAAVAVPVGPVALDVSAPVGPALLGDPVGPGRAGTGHQHGGAVAPHATLPRTVTDGALLVRVEQPHPLPPGITQDDGTRLWVRTSRGHKFVSTATTEPLGERYRGPK